MTTLLHALQAIPGVQAFLAVTLGPMFCFGMLVCRVLARHVGDGWR